MEIFNIQLMYFILTLILGFIIGILFKNPSTDKNIKDKLKNLENEFYSTRDRLDNKSTQLFDTKNKFQINKDLIYTQNNLEKKTKCSINDYKKKISSLLEAKENYISELTYLQKEIKKFENKISPLKESYNKISTTLKELEDLKVEEKNLILLIEDYEKNIKKFTDNKISLTDKLLASKKHISSLIHEINLLSNKGIELKKKKEILKSKKYLSIDDEYEDVKTKMLNYKYKVKELEEQVNNGLKINKNEIQQFISKNESERFIDKIFLKFINNNDKKGILSWKH